MTHYTRYYTTIVFHFICHVSASAALLLFYQRQNVLTRRGLHASCFGRRDPSLELVDLHVLPRVFLYLEDLLFARKQPAHPQSRVRVGPRVHVTSAPLLEAGVLLPARERVEERLGLALGGRVVPGLAELLVRAAEDLLGDPEALLRAVLPCFLHVPVQSGGEWERVLFEAVPHGVGLLLPLVRNLEVDVEQGAF